MRKRRTARVYVFDPSGRVLLIRYAIPRSTGEFVFWLTPGGEIEPGETPEEAAGRELREELGLDVAVQGPVYTESNQFEHQGERRNNTDFFFVARCGAAAPRLTGHTPEEKVVMREIRWWSVDDIVRARAAGHTFFPMDIEARVRQLRG